MVGPPLICRSVSDPPILASTRLLSSERRVLVVYSRQIWNQMDSLFCLFRKKKGEETVVNILSIQPESQ